MTDGRGVVGHSFFLEVFMFSKIKLRNAVEQVLHVKGNYRGGILEMAIVLDCNISAQTAMETAKELVTALKQQSEIFRNVRLNMIQWKSDEELIKDVTSMALLQTGAYFERYESQKEEKALERLIGQLKKFYARSKLIFVLTDGNFIVQNKEELEESFKPFLEKKLIFIKIDEQAGETQIERSLSLLL